MVSLHDKNLSKKPPVSESRECFSINEVKERLDTEYSRNRLRLLKIATSYCRKLKKLEPEDLVHETYKRFLEGTRQWKKDSIFFSNI